MAKINPPLSLFPMLEPPSPSCSPAGGPAPLSGIARMAAEGLPLDEGHLVEFLSLNSRSLLNRTVSKRNLGFSWSINPYRGCEFGCRYCYARYTHEFMDLRSPGEFETKIFIKQNAAWLLEQELQHVRDGEEIAIGTATDPYQPIERRAKVTQAILEVLARRRGLHLGLVTKSTLVERDIPLLERVAANNSLVVCITVTTPDPRLARLLEPRAPRPDLRLRTVARLRRAGLRAGVLCSPVLPGLTDTARNLDRMARRAKSAGACFLGAQPLFLKSCSKEVYLDFIRRNFPELEGMYRERFGNSGFVSSAYRERVLALAEMACRKYGLGKRDRGKKPGPPERPREACLFSA